MTAVSCKMQLLNGAIISQQHKSLCICSFLKKQASQIKKSAFSSYTLEIKHFITFQNSAATPLETTIFLSPIQQVKKSSFTTPTQFLLRTSLHTSWSNLTTGCSDIWCLLACQLLMYDFIYSSMKFL